jgi:Arylsulfotransferase (ASST)
VSLVPRPASGVELAEGVERQPDRTREDHARTDSCSDDDPAHGSLRLRCRSRRNLSILRGVNRGQFLSVAAAAALATRFPELASAADENLQHFLSRPDLKPPRVTVRGVTTDFVFLAPSSGPGQRGAMILDGRGDLVWFHSVADKVVTDFKVQHLHGRPVLTWWEGKSRHGIGDGEWVVVDSAYHELARVRAARSLAADLHDFQLTRRGTALGLANELVPWRHGQLLGGVVQELELPSGRLVHEWRSAEHVEPDETAIRAQPGPRFDYFHINSVDEDADGALIVSARNTWAAYKLAWPSGRILWRLGGKRSDFELGPGVRFYWQHDVRAHPGGLVSVFDNGAAPAEEAQSRALLLHVDERRRRASLVHAYTHRPERVLSHFMGNAQLLADGHVFVGWGGAQFVTEFTGDGSIRFDARLPKAGQSYRAFRFPWTGRPAGAPALAAANGWLYASWNGATEVASWQLLEDGRTSQTVPRTGFETQLRPTAAAKRASVVALDARGAPFGRSADVTLA